MIDDEIIDVEVVDPAEQAPEYVGKHRADASWSDAEVQEILRLQRTMRLRTADTYESERKKTHGSAH